MTCEYELDTPLSIRYADRYSRKFLKGPIPLPAIAMASRLPGKALAVFLAVYHQVALTRHSTVTLPRSLLASLGVDKDAKSRALKALVGANLVQIHQVPGQGARVILRTSQPDDLANS